MWPIVDKPKHDEPNHPTNISIDNSVVYRNNEMMNLFHTSRSCEANWIRMSSPLKCAIAFQQVVGIDVCYSICTWWNYARNGSVWRPFQLRRRCWQCWEVGEHRMSSSKNKSYKMDTSQLKRHQFISSLQQATTRQPQNKNSIKMGKFVSCEHFIEQSVLVNVFFVVIGRLSSPSSWLLLAHRPNQVYLHRQPLRTVHHW